MFKYLLLTQKINKRLFIVKNKTEVNECITQILKLNEAMGKAKNESNSGAGSDLSHIYWNGQM